LGRAASRPAQAAGETDSLMCWSFRLRGVSVGYPGVWRGIREVSPEVCFEVSTPRYPPLAPRGPCGVRAASSLANFPLDSVLPTAIWMTSTRDTRMTDEFMHFVHKYEWTECMTDDVDVSILKRTIRERGEVRRHLDLRSARVSWLSGEGDSGVFAPLSLARGADHDEPCPLRWRRSVCEWDPRLSQQSRRPST
jgi:hypothetical protein